MICKLIVLCIDVSRIKRLVISVVFRKKIPIIIDMIQTDEQSAHHWMRTNSSQTNNLFLCFIYIIILH